MCTPKESKLFINTINDISTREMPHFTNKTLVFDETDFMDQFPVKDRSKSRARYHASKRDKAKHYNKNLNKEMRNERISHSGFNYSKGKSHNQDSLEYKTFLDLKSYNKNDSNKGNETINPTDIDKEQLQNCFLSVKFPDSNHHIAVDELFDELKNLSEKGIEISTEIRDSLFDNRFRRERKLKIDNERPIVSYSIYRYDYYDQCLGTYPTREMAEESKIYLSAMFPEYEHDYYILPVYTYTEEQVREIKELGFIPAVGFVEPGIKWNSCDFHA